ncbi:DNA/RNA non-specific endonuclease [Hymenobacter rubripertinctus]|uniref:DNA/RNA non-specific endonuclease n=1 Tax=Hymenobacter rubripertinctus TaxID=2029981 RepID=A0A418QZ12_9BACT|nr:DNA/RNA non-specific endonuclease [Hymenobacter rubripertinctus]RIY10413.1 DNA/RNA non-specific endonuclease [Hymenobacter rubripertinctus]
MLLFTTSWRVRVWTLLVGLCLTAPAALAQTTTTESFDSGSKAGYAAASVTLSSGSWTFDDALLGSDANDHVAGVKAARIRNAGRLTMEFFLPDGAATVTVRHALYGTDGGSGFELWYQSQVCSPGTWIKVGGTVITNAPNLQTASFAVNVPGQVRFELRKVSGGTARLNLDDFVVAPFASTPPPPPPATGPENDHLTMGNPSGAVADINQPTNYLLSKPQYAVSYNRDQGKPNWVSWYLADVWTGTAARQNDFRTDNTLPAGWYQVGSSSYSGSGFDRGHNCPSADRTSTVADNSATFLMTNMIPQSPANNQKTWATQEGYSRTLVDAGNELYIIMGSYGLGGTGTNGYAATIDGGRIRVPNRVWKVIVVLPVGTNDVSRVSSSTRIIAIDAPNDQSATTDWGQYRVSVDAIEAATGLDLLSALPLSVQEAVEAKVDNGPTK